MLIITLAALVLSLTLGGLSERALVSAVEKGLRLQSEAVTLAEAGQPDAARERIVRLAEYWEDRADLLETLTSHDALHAVASAIAEARICLDCGDHDDFLRTMAVVRAGLEHIRDEEAVSLSNLY